MLFKLQSGPTTLTKQTAEIRPAYLHTLPLPPVCPEQRRQRCHVARELGRPSFLPQIFYFYLEAMEIRAVGYVQGEIFF